MIFDDIVVSLSNLAAVIIGNAKADGDTLSKLIEEMNRQHFDEAMVSAGYKAFFGKGLGKGAPERTSKREKAPLILAGLFQRRG